MMDASSNYLLSIPDDVEGFLPYNYRCSFIECCGIGVTMILLSEHCRTFHDCTRVQT